MPPTRRSLRGAYRQVRELVADGMQLRPSVLLDAGAYWDDTYSSQAVRDRHARKLRRERALDLVRLGTTRTHVGVRHRKLPRVIEPWMRLTIALDDLANKPIDFSTLKRNDRIAWAARIVVLAWTTTDPDAAESEFKLTDLQQADWCAVPDVDLAEFSPTLDSDWEPAVDTDLLNDAIETMRELLQQEIARLESQTASCRDEARTYARRLQDSGSVLDLLVWSHYAHEAASCRAKAIPSPANPEAAAVASVLAEPNIDAERGEVGAVWRFLDYDLGIAGGIDAGAPGLWEMAMCAAGITSHTSRDDLTEPFRGFKDELRRHDEERRRNGGMALLDSLLSQLHERFPTVAADLPKPRRGESKPDTPTTASSVEPKVSSGAEPPQIETDPLLWGDPLWSKLENARTLLQEQPRILHDKKPDWEGGLDINEINRMAQEAGLPAPVVEQSSESDGDLQVKRFLTFHHPGPPPSIVVTVWNRIAPCFVPPAQMERIIAYLLAWQELRASQLPVSGLENAQQASLEGRRVISSYEASQLWQRSESWWRDKFGSAIPVAKTGTNKAKLCDYDDVASFAADHEIARR